MGLKEKDLRIFCEQLNRFREIENRRFGVFPVRNFSRSEYDLLDDLCRDHDEEASSAKCFVTSGEEISREKYLETVFEKSRESIYGDKYKQEGQMETEKFQESSERQTERAQEDSEGQMERAQFFESLSSLEDLKDFMLKCKRVFHYVIRDPSKSVEFFNFSVSEDFRLSLLDAMNAHNWEKVESLIMPIAVAFPGRAAVFHAFFISAAVLLSMVYQYLQGVIDGGCGKTYSSGSLEFRSTYISIVLFQGAYVWIKFRDVASVRHTSYVNKEGVTVHRYEPRFRLRGSKNYVSVGYYEERDHAEKVYNMCAFYYGNIGDEGVLPLGDGTSFPIPAMTDADFPCTEEEMRLGLETVTRRNVAAKVKKVWDDYLAFLRFLDSVTPSDQDQAQRPPCAVGAPGEQPPAASGAPVDDRGDGERGEQPPDRSGAPVDDLGDGGRGEQPPDPNGAQGEQPDEEYGDGAPGDQPPDPHRPLHANSLMDSDDLSSQREVKELRRENKLLQLELKHQTERSQLQEQHYKERIAELEQHYKERIAEFEGEEARLQSKESRYKRSRTSLT